MVKCENGDCSTRAALIVGDCGYCHKHFCVHHRLPEVHSCTGLNKCREIRHEFNKVKLMSEKLCERKVM